MNKLITFGFSTLESLVQKLNSVENSRSLFRLYEENKDQFKHEHIVQSFRLLGKFTKELNQDANYNQITSKLEDIIGQLTENDAVDILFWLRKFRSQRIPTGINKSTQELLFQHIQQMSQKQMFSLINLCNIYYDFSVLNQQSESLANSISENIVNSQQLSPVLILSLFNSIVIKVKHCNLSKNDLTLLNNVIKAMDKQLDTFDLKQKSLLFKYCAEVQFQNLPPKFLVPLQYKKLKEQLMKSLNQLQEEEILDIFKAYQHFPKQYDFDLLRDLKDKIIRQLEQTPQSISDQFLIQLAIRMIKLTQRLNLEIIKKVLNEVCNRIKKKTIDVNLLDQLIPTLMKYKKIDFVIQTFQQLENKTIQVMNFLYLNGVNTKSYVDQFIKKGDLQTLSLNDAITYATFSDRDAKEHYNTFQQICMDEIKKNPFQSLKLISENDLNFQTKFKFQEEAYLTFIGQIKQQQKQNQQQEFIKTIKLLIRCCCSMVKLSPFSDYFSTLILNYSFNPIIQQYKIRLLHTKIEKCYPNVHQQQSKTIQDQYYQIIYCLYQHFQVKRLQFIQNQIIYQFQQNENFNNTKCRNALLELYDSLDGQVSCKQIIQKLTQQELDVFEFESFSAFTALLLKDPKNIPILKTVDYLTLNTEQLQELIKSDHIQLAVRILITAYQYQPDQKLFPIVNFVQRFETQGYQSWHLIYLVERISAIYRFQNQTSPFPDPFFVNLLINYNKLSPNDAIIQLSHDNIPQNIKCLLLGIASLGEIIPPNILAEIKQMRKSCFQSLKIEKKFQNLLDLVQLGDLNHIEISAINSKIQAWIPQLTHKQYFELVLVAKNSQILGNLANQFNEFSSKLGINKIIIAAEKFAKYQIQSQAVYNILLEVYGNYFFTIYNEQRIQILQIFQQAKIKQVEVFRRSLEKIKQQPSAYKIYYNNLLEYIINLGFVEKNIVDLIIQIFDKASISGQVALKLIQYYVLTDQPIQMSEKLVKDLIDIKNKDNYRTALIYEILLRKHPNSQVTKAHQIFFQDEIFNKMREVISTPNTKITFIQEYSSLYLQILGVQVELDKNINNVNVKFYLPQIEASIYIASQTQLNYDQSLNGLGILEKKLLESVTKRVIVVNFTRFLQMKNEQERVIYLMNLGIPINVDTNKLNFTSVQALHEQYKEKSQGIQSNIYFQYQHYYDD